MCPRRPGKAYAWLSLIPALAISCWVRAEDAPYYPIVADGKWGYMDASGRTVIPPRFDLARGVFTGRFAPASQGGLAGLIDRQGQWVVAPAYEGVIRRNWPEQESVFVTNRDGKQGFITAEGKPALEPLYDEIGSFSEAGAWVRFGKFIGLVRDDGSWAVEPRVLWGEANPLPEPIRNGVSWFEREMRWGLITREGRIPFKPVFQSLCRYDRWGGLEDYKLWWTGWNDDRAWVAKDRQWWLIDTKGDVLRRLDASEVTPWRQRLLLYRSPGSEALVGLSGLVNWDGKVLTPPLFTVEWPGADGPGIIRTGEMVSRQLLRRYGIPETGYLLRDDGSFIALPTNCQPAMFSEGLALLRHRKDSDPALSDVVAVDLEGRIVFELPDSSGLAEPFSEGLAAVLFHVDRKHNNMRGMRWGFVDRTGKVVIAPRFGWTSPFHHGFAWVKEPMVEGARERWGLIDRTGKQVVDFKYVQPPRPTGMRYQTSYGLTPHDDLRRGDLLILHGGHSKGLARTDGTILFEPRFNWIGPFFEGMAVVTEGKAGISVLGYLDSDGVLRIAPRYERGTRFARGVAFVSETGKRNSWGLVDRDGKVLLPLDYDSPTERIDYYGNPFSDSPLARISRSDEKSLSTTGWGWVNSEGKILFWTEQAK